MLNKEIKIRPIALNGFLASIRKGFSFDTDIMLPSFSQFEINCIKTNKKQLKRNSKKNVFWVPDFCYCGTVMATKSELSLKSLLPENRNETTACDEFNKYFLDDVPKDKKYYYYKRLSSPNMPAYYFGAGVRLVASIIKQWQKYNEVNEFFLAQKLLAFINASGIFEIIGLMPKKVLNSANDTNSFSFKYNELQDDFIVSLALNKNEVVVVDTMVDSRVKINNSRTSPSFITTSKENKNRPEVALGAKSAITKPVNPVIVEKTPPATLAPVESQKTTIRENEQSDNRFQLEASVIDTENSNLENNTPMITVGKNDASTLIRSPSQDTPRHNNSNNQMQGFIQTIAPKTEQPSLQRKPIINTDEPLLDRALLNDDKKENAVKTEEKPAITTRSGFIIGDY